MVRISENDDDDKEKYCLSLSILNFIKSASFAEEMKPHMQDMKHEFKDILRNEDTFSSPKVKKCPIDIENSCMGN
jgi:hypothetical protein